MRSGLHRQQQSLGRTCVEHGRARDKGYEYEDGNRELHSQVEDVQDPWQFAHQVSSIHGVHDAWDYTEHAEPNDQQPNHGQSNGGDVS